MIIPASVTDSITAAGIDVSNDWLSSSTPVWNADYSAILTQPISIAATPLADMRFLSVTTTTITIRVSSAPLSLVSWSGIATLVADGTTGGPTTFPVHNSLTGRDVADVHPLASITDLVDALDGKAPAFVSDGQRLFWATPSGASGIPSLRAIAAVDIPTLNQNTTGSAATLTTARTLTIGTTGKTFNGGANVSWSLAEIGAAPAFTGTSGNQVFATPNGSSGVPGLRLLVPADIPSGLNYLPIVSNATGLAPAANFGVNGTSAYSYQVATTGQGVSMQDTRGLNWRGGLYVTDAYWGLSQDASLASSFKPFIIGDGRTSSTWLKIDPLATIKTTITGGATVGGTLNMSTGNFQIAGTNAITSARAGNLTGLDITGRIQSTVDGYQTGSAAIVVTSANPAIMLKNTTNTADSRIWRMMAAGAGKYAIDSYDDVESSALRALDLSRSGGVINATIGVPSGGGSVRLGGAALYTELPTGFVRSASGSGLLSASPLIPSDLPVFYENHADGAMSPTGSGGTNVLVQSATEAIGSLTTNVAPMFSSGRAIEFELSGTGISNASAGNHSTGFRIASSALGFSPLTDTIVIAFPSGSMAYKWSVKARVIGRYFNKVSNPTLFTPVIFLEYAVTLNGLSYAATATATGGTVDAASAINATWTAEAVEGSALLPASMHCVYSRIK